MFQVIINNYLCEKLGSVVCQLERTSSAQVVVDDSLTQHASRGVFVHLALETSFRLTTLIKFFNFPAKSLVLGFVISKSAISIIINRAFYLRFNAGKLKPYWLCTLNSYQKSKLAFIITLLLVSY